MSIIKALLIYRDTDSYQLDIEHYRQELLEQYSEDTIDIHVRNIEPNNHKKTLKMLYDLQKYCNPPFFDIILLAIEPNDFSTSALKKVYNMCILGGYFMVLKKLKDNQGFRQLYGDQVTKGKMNGKYYAFIKENNKVFVEEAKYRVVDFIIMGVQKGGTTALANNIGLHPNICIDMNPDPKVSEVHFFDLKWDRGVEWYKRRLVGNRVITDNILIGEKTPDLMYLNSTFPLIQYINPFVKLIFILRNPAERAYSSWNFMVKQWGEKRSFTDVIKDNLDCIKKGTHNNKTFETAMFAYLERGLYYKQMIEVYKWFPRQNVMVLISEKVKMDMVGEYGKIYEFLSLGSLESLNSYKFLYESHSASLADTYPAMYKKLMSFYKKDIKMLENLLEIETGWL